MISGVACAIKELNPKVKVIGVQTSRLPSMKAALEAGKPVTLPVSATLADGIAVRRAGEQTFPVVQKYVDEMVTVEEDEIASAILLLLEREKTLVEGAGAAGIAAMMHGKVSGLEDRKVASVISGGNLDVSILSRIIERGLAEDGRMVRLRIHLPDYPGALHKLTGVLAQHRANIVQTSYDRTYFGVDLGNTAIDLTMETRGSDHVKELIGALTAEHYQFERIQ